MIEKENVIKGLESLHTRLLDMAMQDSIIMLDVFMVANAIDLLKEQEAVEPKTGHWIYKKHDDMFMCSSCEKYSIRNDYPYCHWCGAKMNKKRTMTDECRICKYFFETDSGECVCCENGCVFEEEENVKDEETNVQAHAKQALQGN